MRCDIKRRTRTIIILWGLRAKPQKPVILKNGKKHFCFDASTRVQL